MLISIDPPLVSIANESPYMTNVDSLAILYCRATGNPIPRVQWYKDDTAVNPISSSFQQTLIVPTDMPHTTVYTCKGTNYIGNMKHTGSAGVTVIVKGNIIQVCNCIFKSTCSHYTLSSTSGCSCEWQKNNHQSRWHYKAHIF